jgi:hypothetical protein
VLIACNGGPLSTELSLIFAPLNPLMFVRENDPSWDIGAFIDAARGPCKDYDAILCLGESIYFHKEGWLKRYVEAWEKTGPGFYGSFSSNFIRPHLQTMGFFTTPYILQKYPVKILNRSDRYQFEHGENCIWRRVVSWGLPVRLVTFDGEWEPRMWRMAQNIHYRGDQSNCLMWCNHSDGYANADAKTKAQWARSYDLPFESPFR